MWSKWYITTDNGISIKRYCKIEGKVKWERYPAKEYKHLDRADAEALVRRINVTFEVKKKEAEERYNFNHAFINGKVLERYKEFLSSSANSEHHINSMMMYITTYTIEFFVIIKKKPDPKAWASIEDKWGVWLAEDQKLSYNSIKQIVFNANRFLKFLHQKVYGAEVPLMILTPLSRNRMKLIKLNSTDDRYKFISEDKFKDILTIAKQNDKEMIPYLNICYSFGLRINESLGCQVDDVFTDSLEVVRQGSTFEASRLKTKPLKGLEARSVPYWFATPAQAHEWISDRVLMSPGYLNRRMNAVLAKHGHQSHDLRRSFVTRALRLQHWRGVMRAAGHKDMETTLRYDQVITNTERKRFVPTSL